MKNDVIFTPHTIVRFMLDKIGYTPNADILYKTILEPSFGDGAFLLEIMERLIQKATMLGYDKEQIKTLLGYIYGFEINPVLYQMAMENIESLLFRYDIHMDMRKNLICGNTLEEYKKLNGQFDFVVGNPPYIRIHDLDEETRWQIKQFPFTDGTSDMYIVFFYIGVECLKEDGQLCYITPNSYLRNTSQHEFREYLRDKIRFIYDYKSNKVFDSVDTYVCITGIQKHSFSYYSCSPVSSIQYVSHNIPSGEWTFASDDDAAFLRSVRERSCAMSDLFYVQNGFATNRDSVYIGKISECEPPQRDVALFNGYPVETALIHPVVKGSRGSYSHILFPYPSDDEKKFAEKFPLAYRYLEHHKEDLLKRDTDGPWYQFGRKQGFQQVGVRKLTFKHVIEKNSDSIQLMELPEDTFVYSGIYICEKDASLTDAVSYLTSPDFLRYCKLVGKDMANGYVNVTAKQVAEYRVN